MVLGGPLAQVVAGQHVCNVLQQDRLACSGFAFDDQMLQLGVGEELLEVGPLACLASRCARLLKKRLVHLRRRPALLLGEPVHGRTVPLAEQDQLAVLQKAEIGLASERDVELGAVDLLARCASQ